MKKILSIVFGILLASQLALAVETTGEKVQKEGNDVKRATKKTVHRAEEGIDCAQDDVKCAETKAKNRGKEASDASKDKGKEIKNKVD